MELPHLPTEIINLILYKFKGLQTPTALIIDEEDENRIVIGSIINLLFVPIDYPRIFFQ